MARRSVRVDNKGGVYVVIDVTGTTRPASILEVELWNELHAAPPTHREVYLRVSETDLRNILNEVEVLRKETEELQQQNASVMAQLQALDRRLQELGEEPVKGILPSGE